MAATMLHGSTITVNVGTGEASLCRNCLASAVRPAVKVPSVQDSKHGASCAPGAVAAACWLAAVMHAHAQ
jgi:hypothetical protein